MHSILSHVLVCPAEQKILSIHYVHSVSMSSCFFNVRVKMTNNAGLIKKEQRVRKMGWESADFKIPFMITQRLKMWFLKEKKKDPAASLPLSLFFFVCVPSIVYLPGSISFSPSSPHVFYC